MDGRAGHGEVPFLATGSAAVVPHTAYLTPLEAPDATIKLVRQLWGITDEGV